ncbi:MAG: aminotransferase class V-fold PLP-dependent enzyme [Chitinophagales bacterium]|nr:aminotransferase class V-fold PLP-dependent enzyme [Chitinophagales bacterium]
MTEAQIQEYRQDTPGVDHYMHFNNAGAALMPAPVISAIQKHIELEAVNGGYEAASIARKQIDNFYTSLAKLINTSADNIAFSGSSTQAYTVALSSIPFQKGDVIITTNEDYVSNQIAFLQLEKYKGIKLLRVPDREEGGFDIDAMEDLARVHHPRLIAVTHIPTSSGLIQDVEGAGKICKKYDCLYLVDACQSVGQLELDVEVLQCDFLTASFRKFMRGPRGTGFLYASNRVLKAGFEPNFMDLHSARWEAENGYRAVSNAMRFETWERSYALVLGAMAATDYALTIGMDKIQKRVIELSTLLRKQLEGRDHLKVLDHGEKLGGIVTLGVDKWSAGKLQAALRSKGINASIVWQGSALINFANRNLEWALRLSPHYYNTENEIEKVVRVLDTL